MARPTARAISVSENFSYICSTFHISQPYFSAFHKSHPMFRRIFSHWLLAFRQMYWFFLSNYKITNWSNEWLLRIFWIWYCGQNQHHFLNHENFHFLFWIENAMSDQQNIFTLPSQIMFSCQLKANEHFSCAMRTFYKQTWKVSLNSGTCGGNNTAHTDQVLLTGTRISFLCKIEPIWVVLNWIFLIGYWKRYKFSILWFLFLDFQATISSYTQSL